MQRPETSGPAHSECAAPQDKCSAPQDKCEAPSLSGQRRRWGSLDPQGQSPVYEVNAPCISCL